MLILRKPRIKEILNVSIETPSGIFYLATSVYPLVFEEAVSLSSSILPEARFYEPPSITEALQVTPTVLNGSLRSNYTKLVLDEEAVSTSSYLLNGTLRTALHSTSMAEEAISISGCALSNGSIKQILITHVIATEAISVSSHLLNGTLQ